jgi:hypothetical protein
MENKIEIPRHIIEKYADINVDGSWWYENIIDYWQSEKLPASGYGCTDIYFDTYPERSEFKGISTDIDMLIQRNKPDFIRFVFPDMVILTNHDEYICNSDGEFCPNYHSGTGNDQFDEKIERFCKYLTEFMKDEIEGLEKEFSKDIRDEYEYQTSDGAIIESIIANELWTPEDEEELKAA